jgi:hypothetical protein
MHIVAMAWIYVVLMMAITERSVIAAIMTFLLYGVLPLTIILYVMGTPARRRRRVIEERMRSIKVNTEFQEINLDGRENSAANLASKKESE